MDNKRKLPFKKASFMKVLEDGATEKLPIPPAFSKIFEGDIPPWLILEIAETRKCWRVDVEKDGNDGLHLGCGFDCFVKAESLEVGNFLLFTLEEQSILQVKIYEKDGSEKTEGTTIELENKVGSSESPMTPRQTPNIHRETETSPWPTLPSDQYGTYEKPQSDIGGNKRKKGVVSATEQGFCFSMTWKQVNHFIYYMTIPRAMLTGKTFSNKEIVMVKDQEGNSWPVELRLRQDGRVDLARGWRDFVVASGLITGDTLTLAFVADNVIHVHVERTSQQSQVDNSSETQQVCKIEPAEYINMARENEEHAANCNILNNAHAPVTMPKFGGVASALKGSSFSVTYTYKSRYTFLHIPKAVANKQKLEHKDTVVLCDPEGRQWLMEVRTKQSDGRVGLFRGWVEFAKTHGLGVGDTLIFEFVTDHMMKVDIIKASGPDRVNVTGGMLTQDMMLL